MVLVAAAVLNVSRARQVELIADIEVKGEPSRWVTLRALEVLRAHY